MGKWKQVSTLPNEVALKYISTSPKLAVWSILTWYQFGAPVLITADTPPIATKGTVQEASENHSKYLSIQLGFEFAKPIANQLFIVS